jgi:hypothetical protein
MKNRLMAVLAVLLSTAVGLALAEAAFRYILPPVPGSEGSVAEYIATAQRNPGAPRLFPAGYTAVFDIRGLYPDANKVDFKIGPSRFIPPDPAEGAKHKVLFLGGSVTEGIFLSPEQRWPARLNDAGQIATYNASMSQAGVLSHFPTVRYLAERGDRFDLVVLATNHNDASWSRRLAEIGFRYDPAQFPAGSVEIFKREFEQALRPETTSLRTVAWLRHLIRVARLSNASTAQDAGASSPHSIVVDGLRLSQNGTQLLPRVPLKDCGGADAPDRISARLYEEWKEIFPKFRQEVKDLLGADLLVVSEPGAFSAPSESFYGSDLRVFLTCKTAEGVRAIDLKDAAASERARARLYLDAARMAGAETFDLASAMAPVADGPQGGSYFFDSIHPTPKGAEKFAELLRPVLKQALDRSQRD